MSLNRSSPAYFAETPIFANTLVASHRRRAFLVSFSKLEIFFFDSSTKSAQSTPSASLTRDTVNKSFNRNSTHLKIQTKR
ncbi:hypothetical protein PGB90_007179 [Kerria lacca]